MKYKTNLRTATALAVACSAGFCGGCSKPAEMVEVKCIAVHCFGDTKEKAGWMNERFTYMTAERLDTHERRNFTQILGQTNDVFEMDWTQEHYE
jgi:hypothetical protein